MNSTEVYFFLIDGEVADFVKNVIKALVKASSHSVVFDPTWQECIESESDLVELLRVWSKPRCLKWRIAGQIVARNNEKYDGPFASHIRSEAYEQQINQLMSLFDWAIFSYSMTFSDEMFFFITRNPELSQQLSALKKYKEAVLERYHIAPPFIPLLKNITFGHYGAEGRLVYQLATERGEAVPLVLCEMPPDGQEYHANSHAELTGGEAKAWFDEILSKLELVESFNVLDPYAQRITYRLYRAINQEAYKQLWSMASENNSIVCATLAADCNIPRLKQCLSKKRFDVIRHTESVASWAYGLIYGGGSDEHHAVFHARDAAITQQLWQALGKSAISRF